MSEEAEVLFERRGGAGIITLNRPKALNALTLGMVRLIHPRLESWALDGDVRTVILEGAGERALCAGGDIRVLHDWGRAGDPRLMEFYREEYRLNRYIKRYPKPYVALMDGIDMGGGVGLSVHGSLRVATERLVFAMPETGIGLFPDVGGTFFLPRCPGATGMYLALTGERLRAADAIYAGIADIFVPGDRLEALKATLAEGATPEDVTAAFAADAGAAPLASLQEKIDRHFSAASLEAVLASLNEAADGGDAWAKATLATLAGKSPTSLLVTFSQMKAGAKLDFEACMQLEYRLTNRFMEGHDFYEGVRAVVIDKDQKPRWQPARLADVPRADIEKCFAPLSRGELSFE
ncbi:MAG: enoyl-CoA hydratase/isomerase family protein [Parvibaculaceae bacterium]|nr:enoyl-CoA hydratase/isomerase family protein [Parvibaculaceae bacterium]